MELLANRDPETAGKLVDPVLERMMEAVHHYEGTVNRIVGDGIMALFGAPLAHEDHAVRACYASLRMQETVKEYAQEVRRTEALSIQIRVGLNSGEAVVRAIGSDLQLDAVGQTAHLGARMEQLATPGSILMTSDTLRLAEGYVRATSLGPVNIKGLPEPVEVYELTGAGTARTRLQAAALRGLTRFVGREAEVEHLSRGLAQADAGHGQLVAIVGEAGVGKSRLINEFIHSHRVQKWLILEASSVSYGKATSYLPVIGLLKAYFKIGDRDDHREMREKVTGKLYTLDESLRRILPGLLALLDVPIGDAGWVSLDPPQRRQRMLGAVKRLLLRETQVQPLLVVFEDLHWIDGETQALLDSLVESLGSARLLLLVNYRPEYEHRWGSKSAYSQLRLDSLPAGSTAELLAALLGPDPGLAPDGEAGQARQPVLPGGDGAHPGGDGALVGQRGAYRLTRPVETLQVPATVQTILAARIDRLPKKEKQLLQAASVIGKDVPYALLAAITQQTAEALRQGLAHLQEAEFLYETQLFPDLEHTFKHALTHEVTYGSLLGDRRRELNAQIVAAIEGLYSDRLSEHVERLAHHALRGQLWDKAVRYGRQAGTRALDRSAAREALVHFEQARTASQELPESAERTAQLIDLCFEKRNALFPLAEFGRLSEALDEARALAEGLGDQRRLGWALGYRAHSYTFLGEHTRAISAAEGARTIAEAVGSDHSLKVVANYYLGQAFWFAGEPRRAVEPLSAAIALVKGAPLGERFGLTGLPAVVARWALAEVLAEQGEFAEAIVAGQEGLRIAETVEHRYSEVWARYALGYVHLRQGDFAAATRVLEPGVALCRELELRVALPFVQASLGSTLLWSGRAADAVALLEEVVEALTTMGIVGLRSLFVTFLAEAYLVLGRVAEARQHAEQSLAPARAHEERGWRAWALKLLGDILAHESAELAQGAVARGGVEQRRGDQSKAQQAGAAYRQALALATEFGMRPLVAHCHFGLGRLHVQAGQREDARERLATAMTMYREMDIQFWPEQAAAALSEVDRG